MSFGFIFWTIQWLLIILKLFGIIQLSWLVVLFPLIFIIGLLMVFSFFYMLYIVFMCNSVGLSLQDFQESFKEWIEEQKENKSL
jgi:hypothetical protein